MAGSGNDLGPCPFCGQTHADSVLLCPNSEKLLPLEGRILDRKFRFVRLLGEGGMGAVWKAENVLVKKTVAIKLMHVQFSKDEGVLARFRNEATAAGRIGSEHICDILDLGRSDLGPYIVMEMLRGRDFAQFLQQRQGKVDPGLSVLIVREALRGLAAAHQVGIVHRDLKPENIFLHESKPGQLMVKLMDFGISKFTEGSEAGKTGMGVLMGTPEYMSPEQTEGAAQVDHRTDIWAMGVILYWALSGRNPFLGPTMAATLVNVSTKEPPPLTSLGGHVEPGLIEVIARCLRKNPTERWNSCDEMSNALAPYENRNNGVYSIGAEASSPSGPGRTMASTGSPTPPPGATMASPSGAPIGTGPTMAGLGAPPGVQSPAPAGIGAAPTFMGGTPTGAGGSPTWSNEFQGQAASAPTLGGGASFGLSDELIERRPDSSLGSGGKGGTIVLLVVLLALLGGGGWFAYQKFGAASSSNEVVAEAGDDANAVAGDGNPADDAAAEADDAAGSSGGAGSGGGSAEAGSDGAGSSGGAAANADDDGSKSDDAAAEADDGGSKSDDGGSKSGNGGNGGNGGGGGGGSKPKKVDLGKVSSSGNLYSTKSSTPSPTLSGARAQCSKLKSQKFANARGWRLPSASEVTKFERRSRAGKPTPFWLSDGKVWNNQTGKTVPVLGGKISNARVRCVSK